MGVGGHLRSCGFSGADGPYWFVGYHQVDGFFGRDFVEGAEALAAQHVVGEVGFAFFEDFSYADNGDESGFDGGLELEVDGVVGLAEVLASFRVSDDDVGYTDREQNAGADLAGEGAFLFPMEILRADGYVRALGRIDGGIERKEIWADDNFVAVVAVDHRKEIAEEVTGLVGCFVHLPVGGEEFLSHEGPF